MISAIIAEYNPFHKGHLLHINNTIQNTNCNGLIAILSGNFVQRGEPALFNKAIRTEMALKNGVDMVLELPVEYATGGADVFAYGAIETLNKTGIVDYLSFGSECGNISDLEKIAELLANEPIEFQNLLKEYLQGNSYPIARSKAISEFLGIDEEILKTSNNILAIEYMTALKRTDSKIKPYTLKREINSYNQISLSGEISSATAIRDNILTNFNSTLNSIPENCHQYYNINKIPDINDYTSTLKYILLSSSQEDLKAIADITEGLENRICNNWDFENISQLLDKINTKRYTYSKLKRALLHILLNIKKQDQQKEISYIRVLGFKKERTDLLKKLTENATVPVITNVKEYEEMLKKEILATDIYNINNNLPLGMEFKTSIVKL